MGTDDLDEKLHYSIMSNAILKYIKDAEDESSRIKMSGLQKKEYVIKNVQHNMPHIHEKHSLFIDVMIDTIVSVSKDPSIVKERVIFMGCGC